MDWTATFQSEWRVSLLPRNATAWETVLEIVDADRVARAPTGLIAAARRVEAVPEALLPYLAEERSVDEYDSAWPLARRQAVTAGAFGLHQRKGTRPALDAALEPLGYALDVVEWFEAMPPRPPHTFRVHVTLGMDEPWLASHRSQVVRLANRAKNAHTKLEAITAIRRAPSALVYVGGLARVERTLLVCETIEVSALISTLSTFVGAASRAARTLLVLPRP